MGPLGYRQGRCLGSIDGPYGLVGGHCFYFSSPDRVPAFIPPGNGNSPGISFDRVVGRVDAQLAGTWRWGWNKEMKLEEDCVAHLPRGMQ